MKSVRLRTLVLSSLLGAPIAVAFACGGHADRHFDDPPIDSGDGGAGTGGGSMGGAGTGGDGPSTGGGGGKPPDDVDEPAPNPGCDPPELVDGLVVQSTFPDRGRSSSGKHVVFNFGNLAKDCSVLECRRTYGDEPTGDWAVCGQVGSDKTKARPFTDAESRDSDTNGRWKIEVRERFDGAAGPIFTYDSIYTHDSLDGVDVCPDLPTSESNILARAKTLFEAARSGSTATKFSAYSLANPFVQVTFKPPQWSTATYNGSVASGDGKVEYKSLRRWFTMNSDQTLLLMRRAYPSRRNSINAEVTSRPDAAEYLCHATTVRVHVDPTVNGDQVRHPCDVVVMNYQGFGMCLDVSEAGDVSQVYSAVLPANGEQTGSSYISYVWDSFLWKKLAKYTRTRNYQGMGYFSSKCDDSDPCITSVSQFVEELFLPHRDLYF